MESKVVNLNTPNWVDHTPKRNLYQQGGLAGLTESSALKRNLATSKTMKTRCFPKILLP